MRTHVRHSTGRMPGRLCGFRTAWMMMALLATVAGPSSSRADMFRVQGSTTVNTRLVEPHKLEIEAAAGHKIEVVANMSSTGLIALAEGRADLAMISAGLEQEAAAIRTKMPEFPFNMMRSFEVARVRVAVALHPTNPIRKLSQEQLRRVLLGDLLNWSELGVHSSQSVWLRSKMAVALPQPSSPGS